MPLSPEHVSEEDSKLQKQVVFLKIITNLDYKKAIPTGAKSLSKSPA